MKKQFAGVFGSGRWMIERGAFLALQNKMEMLTPEALHAAEAAAVAYRPSDPTMVGDVAVIPVCGPIFYKPSWYAMYFGGAILTNIRAQFNTALNDPNVSAIVFPFDSPGGIIDMVPEFAKELFAARGKKPMLAVADTMIASAAYWLAAQMDQVFVTESSRVGSVGVYAEHEEISGMLEKIGVKITLIAYGEHKVDGNPYEPLSDVAHAKIQEDVNKAGVKFDTAVARGRGVTKKVVTDTFGGGQMFDGETAISLRMADKVGSIEQVLTKASKNRSARADSGEAHVVAERVLLPAVPWHAHAIEQAETVEPDDDGSCPEGYEKREDGQCHHVPAESEEAKAAAARQAQADRDLTMSTLAVVESGAGHRHGRSQ